MKKINCFKTAEKIQRSEIRTHKHRESSHKNQRTFKEYPRQHNTINAAKLATTGDLDVGGNLEVAGSITLNELNVAGLQLSGSATIA